MTTAALRRSNARDTAERRTHHFLATPTRRRDGRQWLFLAVDAGPGVTAADAHAAAVRVALATFPRNVALHVNRDTYGDQRDDVVAVTAQAGDAGRLKAAVEAGTVVKFTGDFGMRVFGNRAVLESTYRWPEVTA